MLDEDPEDVVVDEEDDFEEVLDEVDEADDVVEDPADVADVEDALPDACWLDEVPEEVADVDERNSCPENGLVELDCPGEMLVQPMRTAVSAATRSTAAVLVIVLSIFFMDLVIEQFSRTSLFDCSKENTSV